MTILDMALRLALALAAGAILGIDRDLARKPAGVRTHSLVSIGAAIVVMLALSLPGSDAGAVSRVIQGLITGIGFIGAGVILHRRERIEGLTTAASVWVAAALGAVAGAGFEELAVVGLAAALVVLLCGGPLERAIEKVTGRAPPGRDH